MEMAGPVLLTKASSPYPGSMHKLYTFVQCCTNKDNPSKIPFRTINGPHQADMLILPTFLSQMAQHLIVFVCQGNRRVLHNIQDQAFYLRIEDSPRTQNATLR